MHYLSPVGEWNIDIVNFIRPPLNKKENEFWVSNLKNNMSYGAIVGASAANSNLIIFGASAANSNLII